MLKFATMRHSECPLCGGEAALLCEAELYPGTQREIAGCKECGAAFYSPMPEGAELANCYHAAYYGGFVNRYWKDYRKGLRLGRELKRIKPLGRYLDVGCALGTMLAGVRKSSGWDVFGTEFSAETAKAGFEMNGVPIIAAPALGQAGLKAGSFDYIFANNVIEHLPEPAQFLREAFLLLKPGGYLRLITPNGESDLSPNVILWKKKHAVLGTRHGGHIWFFSALALSDISQKAGFEIMTLRSFHFLDALKSRGLWPGALARFKRRHSGAKPAADGERQAKPSIPPEGPRLPCDLLALWRGLFKIPGLTCGADFDILLRAKQK